ncbi:ECF transporter S component [Shouchella shacheensis]|uniref:ECF transporter S component n=1 Tax=Shouchella shacheensis TaxID=1649580 RepID=UPI00074001BB|nr:ECF transporter S component [Shouchella shacheensis]
MKRNRLTLTDVMVTIMIAVVFAIVYRLWTPVMDIFSLVGLQGEQLLYGMWFIAATIAMLIIRKPGVAILAETAAASGEFFAGAPYGPMLLLYGLAQGLGTEAAFALFRYQRFTVTVAILGAIGASVASLGLDYYYAYLGDLSTWNLTLRIVFRTVGSIAIAGIFAYLLVRALEKTGVTTMIRPASKNDYDLLDKKAGTKR